jgi:hypothetical protein
MTLGSSYFGLGRGPRIISIKPMSASLSDSAGFWLIGFLDPVGLGRSAIGG